MKPNRNLALNHRHMHKDGRVSYDCNRCLQEIISDDMETIIRIGVKDAAEAATEETKRRKLNAPLTIEEKIFTIQGQGEAR